MGLGVGSWLGLDVVAKLCGLLCSCFFKTSAHALQEKVVLTMGYVVVKSRYVVVKSF